MGIHMASTQLPTPCDTSEFPPPRNSTNYRNSKKGLLPALVCPVGIALPISFVWHVLVPPIKRVDND